MRATPTAVSHVAVITSDLDRFGAFYTEVIGLRMGVVLRQTHEPYLRHAVLQVGDTATIIHVFEQPGYNPVGDGMGTELGRRGRIDHFGFMVSDRGQLEEVACRLVAADASDGEVRPMGPVLSVHYRDPDGLEGEINAANVDFVPEQPGGCTIEKAGGRTWLDTPTR